MRAWKLAALFIVVILARTAAPAHAESWLDQASPVGWNTAGRAVPTAAVDPNTPVDPRCAAQYRSPSKSRADRAVVKAGWSLVGPLQVFGDTELVTAASGADGMCRPLGYQAFVFRGGKFVGTLSPQPMASRTDGMAGTVRLLAPDRLHVEFARYADRDPLCCPSASTFVTFAIHGTGRTAVVEPVDARTEANAPASGAVAAPAVIRGIAAYRERIALPADAVFEAMLEDISIADRPAELVGSARVQPAGQVPIRFEIAYDPARIVAGHKYAVRARITLDDKLLFTTTRIHPALAGEAGAELMLDLQGTGRPVQEPDRPLANTYWKLVRLGDREVTVVEGRREAHLVLRTDGRTVGGSGGCNSLNGAYELDGATLTFGPLATTKMMCAETMEQEHAFLQALGAVRGWHIQGDRLEMLDGSGAAAARFLAVDLE
jgi:putative lipoprotein